MHFQIEAFSSFAAYSTSGQIRALTKSLDSVVQAMRGSGRYPDHLLTRLSLNRNMVIFHLFDNLEKPQQLQNESEEQYAWAKLRDKDWVYATAARIPGVLYATLPAPFRHADVIRLPTVMGAQEQSGKRAEEGFMVFHYTEDRKLSTRYVNRTEAMQIASANGQLRRRVGDQFYQGPELYSEDLW